MQEDQSNIQLKMGSFSGPSEFAQQIRDALEAAAKQGWSEMVWSDANFADWPLRERSVVESLQQWSQAGRKLVMLAWQYEDLRRLQPRFVTWRVTWDHIVDCRICRHIDPSDFPSALWGPRWFCHRREVQRSVGISGDGAVAMQRLREVLGELHRSSRPGFPATTLGL